MRTTAILNLKGGVGKTTTVINMAAILAKVHGRRVLVIDGDSQCNLTHFFGVDGECNSLADLLRGNITPAESLPVAKTDCPGIAMIPADNSLMELDLSSAKEGRVSVEILRRALKELEYLYDVCLIDCPASFNAAAAAALVAADDVVIPIKLDAFSVQGMLNLDAQIQNMRRINPALKLAGLLPTMWYKGDMIQKAEEILRSGRYPLFSHIRRSDRVDDSTYAQKPLCQFSPHCGANVDYRRFVSEYIGGIANG